MVINGCLYLQLSLRTVHFDLITHTIIYIKHVYKQIHPTMANQANKHVTYSCVRLF